MLRSSQRQRLFRQNSTCWRENRLSTQTGRTTTTVTTSSRARTSRRSLSACTRLRIHLALTKEPNTPGSADYTMRRRPPAKRYRLWKAARPDEQLLCKEWVVANAAMHAAARDQGPTRVALCDARDVEGCTDNAQVANAAMGCWSTSDRGVIHTAVEDQAIGCRCRRRACNL